MNRKILIVAVACLSAGYLAGCAQTGSSTTEQPSTQAPTAATPSPAAPMSSARASSNVIFVSQEMRYADPAMIAMPIMTECRLPQQGVELLETAARREGFNLVRDDQAVKARRGRALHVEITNVISSGNAFIGHSKQVMVRGRLFEDGKEVGNFQGMRTSMGGAFGGFKGSCSVLGRCLETLSKDITLWLKNPAKDSRIGQ